MSRPSAFTSYLVGVLPAGPGVCFVCHGTIGDYTTGQSGKCRSCDQIIRTLSIEDPTVIPLALAAKHSPLAAALWGYKNGTNPEHRGTQRRDLTDLMDWCMPHVLACLEDEGFEPTIVSYVPSRRISGEPVHQLLAASVWAETQNVEAVLNFTADDPPPRQAAKNKYLAHGVNGESVLLIDDTWTTGATIFNAIYALEAAGAIEVKVVVIGRHFDPEWRNDQHYLDDAADRPFDPSECAHCARIDRPSWAANVLGRAVADEPEWEKFSEGSLEYEFEDPYISALERDEERVKDRERELLRANADWEKLAVTPVPAKPKARPRPERAPESEPLGTSADAGPSVPDLPLLPPKPTFSDFAATWLKRALAVLVFVVGVAIFVDNSITSAPTGPDDSNAAGPDAGKIIFSENALLLSVADGKTLSVRLTNGSKAKVRLAGIDAPNTPPNTECGRREAARHLKKILTPGESLKMFVDTTQGKTGSNGYLLRYVVSEEYGDIARTMVESGYGSVFANKHNPAMSFGALTKAESIAKSLNAGAWGSC